MRWGKLLIKHNSKLQLIATGFARTLLTPIAYLMMGGYDITTPKKSELLAWFLNFVFSDRYTGASFKPVDLLPQELK
ncbi:hypothetical protein [Sphingobacterium paucimobilis]|uniref:Uncharacterized protein n=1 Tax=Sphingobacterium paucimobilis HER1398 TaxID=1346330 RepID=U2HPJ0_9SPHI|nr:hypothetical protein [Sphingobacterium paucimobilis]ERJ57205.1 hypothetical protein M472_00350 [Sphingobacterium paucimobilis HER1398]